MDENVLLSDKNMQTAFKIFDLDGDNTISINEIKTLLSYGSNTNDNKVIEEIIKEIDKNGDGEIDY
jgi:Ca2+-binding EF-hand superfamily protein